LGDKKGRLSVLFGSILLYSLANIGNGFVQTYAQYAVLRFIAGIGLAGELGASITLVSELVSKEHRGICTSIIASVGLCGAIAAYYIKEEFSWRACYFIGGGLGLLLLALRVSIFESGLFAKMKDTLVERKPDDAHQPERKIYTLPQMHFDWIAILVCCRHIDRLLR